MAKAERHLDQAATILAKRADPDSLAAAGLLKLTQGRDQSLALLMQATAAAPERADLVWLEVQVCGAVAPCDPDPLERRLRSLDPSNGAAWLGALSRANDSKDEEAKDAALAAIGHSDRVDIYWTTLIARLTRAVAATRVVSLSEAETGVIGLLSARAIPAYSVISNSCKGARLEQSQIVEVCQGIARAFEHGDTYMTELVGVSIAKRVWAEGSPEWREASEARRTYDYRSKFWSELEADPGSTAAVNRFLALCAQNRREQDVMSARLIDAGEPPNPPSE